MERWKTIAWFVFTVIAILSLIPASNDDATSTGRPTSQDQRASGLAALVRWLQSADIPVHSQRYRFNDMAAAVAVAEGNVAITHLPAKLIFEGDEIQTLLNWVQQGNTLVVATGHLESTPWIYDGRNLGHSLWRLTGLKIVGEDEDNAAEDEVDDSSPQSSAATGEPDTTSAQDRGFLAAIDEVLATPGWLLVHGSRESVALDSPLSHPFTETLGHIEVPWDGSDWKRLQAADGKSHPWTGDIASCAAEVAAATQLQRAAGQEPLPVRMLRGKNGCLRIPTPAADDWQTLLRHENSEQPALFGAALGAGRLFVLLHASLLGNEVIHRFDNRSFTQALVAQHLGYGGSVVIDDAHQGENDILDAADLLSDGRFYASIGFVLIFWLAFLLADSGQWQRATYKALAGGISQRDLVLGSANFLRRRLHPKATVDAILDPLRQQLATKWSLPLPRALVEGLALEAAQHPKAVAELQYLLGRVERQQKVAFTRLHQAVHQLTNV